MPVRLVGHPIAESMKSSKSSSGIEISKGFRSHRSGRGSEKVPVELLRSVDFGGSGDRFCRPHNLLAALEVWNIQFYNLDWEFLENSTVE